MQSLLNHPAGRRAATSGFIVAILATVLLAGGCATAPTKPTVAKAGPPPRLDPSRPLQVSVESPITHPWIWDDRVAESFYSLVVKGFRAGGYQGSIVYVFSARETPRDTQRIELRLHSWKLNFDKSVEATMTAVYDSGDGVRHDLGIVRGESMAAFAMQDRISLEKAFDESARNAARNLLQEIAPVK